MDMKDNQGLDRFLNMKKHSEKEYQLVTILLMGWLNGLVSKFKMTVSCVWRNP